MGEVQEVGGFEVKRKKSKSIPAPAVLNPRPGCRACGGTGWVPQAAAPAMSRDVVGLANRVEFRPRVVRCSCTKPEQRAIDQAQGELDQARKASGERES